MLHFPLTIIEIVDTSKLHMRYVLHESISSKIGWVHHKTVSVSNASYSSVVFFFSPQCPEGKKKPFLTLFALCGGKEDPGEQGASLKGGHKHRHQLYWRVSFLPLQFPIL